MIRDTITRCSLCMIVYVSTSIGSFREIASIVFLDFSLISGVDIRASILLNQKPSSNNSK